MLIFKNIFPTLIFIIYHIKWNFMLTPFLYFLYFIINKKTGSGHSYPVAFIPLNLFNVLPVYSLTILQAYFTTLFPVLQYVESFFYLLFWKKIKTFLYLPEKRHNTPLNFNTNTTSSMLRQTNLPREPHAQIHLYRDYTTIYCGRQIFFYIYFYILYL